MKTIAFTYTKENGDVSKRVLVVSNEPQKNVSGTDITSLSAVDQVSYTHVAKKIRDNYLEELKNLNDLFDVTHNFRQFKPTGMSNITEF